MLQSFKHSELHVNIYNSVQENPALGGDDVIKATMSIANIVKYLLFTLVLLVIVFIPLSIFLVRLNNTSYFGEIIKNEFIKYPEVVKLFNLNEPGDYKYFYSGSNANDLKINVVSVNSSVADERVEIWLDEIMQITLGKNISFGRKNIKFKTMDAFNKDDLNELRDEILVTGKADLNIIYVGTYQEKTSSVGLVLHRDTIFIFKDAIEKLSEKGYIKDVLEKTTIMHEWGHLLGLDHIQTSGCIMYETADVYDNPPAGKSLPTKYCTTELQEIQKQ